MYPQTENQRFQNIFVALISAGFFCITSVASAQQSAGNYKTSYRYNSLGQQTGVVLADPDVGEPVADWHGEPVGNLIFV